MGSEVKNEFSAGGARPLHPLTKLLRAMNKKELTQALLVVLVFILETVFIIGFFLLLFSIVLGLMMGCDNLKEFVTLIVKP